MFGAHAQPILAKDFRDFCHRARPFESEIANNDERFVDQDPGSLPRPEVPRCARRSLWFGSIRRTEFHYSGVRHIPQSSTPPAYKTFNHDVDLVVAEKIEGQPFASGNNSA